MTTVYHPLSVMGGVCPHDGYFDRGVWRAVGKTDDPDDPSFGTTFQLQNTRASSVLIQGLRALNSAWEAIILSLGPLRGPFDVSAFNLDAVPAPPDGSARYPTPEIPRFVYYPIGIMEPGEILPIRACTYGNPAMDPILNLVFFVEECNEENLHG